AVAPEVEPPGGGRRMPVMQEELGEEQQRPARTGQLLAARIVVEQRPAERTGPEVVHDHDTLALDAPARRAPRVEDGVRELHLEEMVAAEVESHLAAAERARAQPARHRRR